MKRMAYQPWVGLPNILCREFVVPELHPGATAPAQPWPRRAALAGRRRGRPLAPRFADLHHLLRRDTARCATDAIAQVLGA
jgi:lipid-A-disaccharide synthase